MQNLLIFESTYLRKWGADSTTKFSLVCPWVWVWTESSGRKVYQIFLFGNKYMRISKKGRMTIIGYAGGVPELFECLSISTY